MCWHVLHLKNNGAWFFFSCIEVYFYPILNVWACSTQWASSQVEAPFVLLSLDHNNLVCYFFVLNSPLWDSAFYAFCFAFIQSSGKIRIEFPFASHPRVITPVDRYECIYYILVGKSVETILQGANEVPWTPHFLQWINPEMVLEYHYLDQDEIRNSLFFRFFCIIYETFRLGNTSTLRQTHVTYTHRTQTHLESMLHSKH